MPLLRAATRLFAGDGLAAGRFVNAMLGGTGVVLMYGIVRRALSALPLGRPFSAEDIGWASTVAAAGLALSYGYWVQGSDVEAYAAAIVALLSTVRLLLAYRARPNLERALAVGVLLGLSVLSHLTHILLTPFVAMWLWTHAPSPRAKLGHTALALVTGGLLTLGLYAWAAFGVRHYHDLPSALAWVMTAQHGFFYGGGAYRVADAVYGLAKTMVWSPYLYEADAQKLIGQLLLGLLPLSALAVLVGLRGRAIPDLEWRLLAVWVVPYALLGLLFFGSDTERWVFILPALWLLAAVALALSPSRTWRASLLLAYLGATNLYTGLLPAHRDAGGVRARAETVAEMLREGDLVIFPGHSWDEYVSFYAPSKVEPFPVSYYAARDGLDACWRRLDKELSEARARSGRVFALRLFDDDDADPRGFDELTQLGLGKTALRDEVRARSSPVTLDARDGLQVVRLDPRPSP
jgi:hypothetical protein